MSMDQRPPKTPPPESEPPIFDIGEKCRLLVDVPMYLHGNDRPPTFNKHTADEILIKMGQIVEITHIARADGNSQTNHPPPPSSRRYQIRASVELTYYAKGSGESASSGNKLPHLSLGEYNHKGQLTTRKNKGWSVDELAIIVVEKSDTKYVADGQMRTFQRGDRVLIASVPESARGTTLIRDYKSAYYRWIRVIERKGTFTVKCAQVFYLTPKDLEKL